MPSQELKPGIVCEEVFRVGEEHAARVLGSGEVYVLSTPSMILFMESVAMGCVKRYLSPGETTVGVKVCVEHKAPAPIGAEVKVRARLIEVRGRRLVFEVKAFWQGIEIGSGTHERYVVDEQRFLEKVRAHAQRRSP